MFSGVHQLDFLCASKAADKSKQADQRRTSARLLARDKNLKLWLKGPVNGGLSQATQYYFASITLEAGMKGKEKS